MADGFVQVPPDSTGKQVDAASLDVGLNTVMRQRMIIADNSATSQYATVTGGALVCTGTFNISAMPTVTVTGGVAISGTAQVAIGTPIDISSINNIVFVTGTVTLAVGAILNNISATVDVAGVVGLTAGAANIGFINHVSRTVQVAIGTPFTVNNISAAVAVTGTVSLGAGTAVIGDLNAISRTVQVAIGTPFTLQGISTTVQVAVATPFTVNNISATVTVAGNVFINTVPAYASASRGPKAVACSTSAGIALIAAPGAGFCVYITQLVCTNGSATLTRADVFQASATASCIAQMYLAASGGGFVRNFDPPIKVLSNTGVTCRVKPSVSETLFNVHFYVAAK